MLSKIPRTARSLAEATWIDLLEPTEDERAEVAAVLGRRLPTQAEIDEIEWSSRVFVEDGALYLSTPVFDRIDGTSASSPTLGFVLAPERLVTLRFGPIAVLDRVRDKHALPPGLGPNEAFLRVLEAIVDHAADSLERAGAELERVSSSAFRSDRPHIARMPGASAELHAGLKELGRMDGGVSHLRDTLLGIDRISAFVMNADCGEQMAKSAPRLQSVRADISSLKDYQVHLASKVSFLLDATLGFINIQQNEIVKALTVASVVGVPPVLIAGVYGMNFQHMPELGSPLGYPLALLAIIASGIVPIVWFKRRGWI